MMRIQYLAAVLAVFLIAAPAAHADWVWTPERGWHNPKTEARGSARDLYTKALKLFEAGESQQAASAFQQLSKQFSGSRYAKKAQFYAGESLFESGSLYEAYSGYEDYLHNFPESGEIEVIVEKEYEIGRAFLNGARKRTFGLPFLSLPSPDTGITILESVIGHSPFSGFADDSLHSIAEYQFRDDQFDAAAATYRRLYTEYPDSEWARKSQYQAAMCSRSNSQGMEYDPGAAERARKQLEEYQAEHPTESNVSGVKSQIAAIDEDLAGKMWGTVAFYEKSGKPFSAAYCCTRLMERFPDTSYAALAAQWLGEHPEASAGELMEDAPDPDEGVIEKRAISRTPATTRPSQTLPPDPADSATPPPSAPAPATPGPAAAPARSGKSVPRSHSTSGSR